MEPLAGSIRPGHSYSGHVSSEEDEGALEESSAASLPVPQLNIELATMPLNDGEVVVPYFTPRGTYQTPRAELTIADLRQILDRNGDNCVFVGRTFNLAAAFALRDYLLSPNCALKYLKIINCGLSEEVFRTIAAGLSSNRTVKTLHIEGFACRIDLCESLKEVLFSPISGLETLNFANVTLPVASFAEIVKGVVAQNSQPNGLTTLCFEGCRLNQNYSEPLRKLISDSRKLQNLMLHGNQLGAAKVAPLKSNPRDLLMLEQPRPELERIPSSAIQAIAAGIRSNPSLLNLILASNRITFADYLELDAALKANATTVVNVTGNNLDVQTEGERLITKGKSPRSIASPLQSEGTPRSQETPRSARPSRFSIGREESSSRGSPAAEKKSD